MSAQPRTITSAHSVDQAGDASTIAGLLGLQQQIRQESTELPPPLDALSPAELKAFVLLRRETPEAYADQFRQLRGRLVRRRQNEELNGRSMKSILVTSPAQGDGKTFVALNLALMLAVAPGARVLLLDLNGRRPAFEFATGGAFPRGLRESVAGLEWTRAVRQVPHMELYLMGISRPEAGTLEPLDYHRLQGWLRNTQDDFDWIVLDGPGFGSGSDAEMLAHIADATLLVVRPGESEFGRLDQVISRLDPSRLAGVTFNGRS